MYERKGTKMVRRIYVEKRPEYAVQAKELLEEIKGYLAINSITGVRILIRYDIVDISDDTYKRAVDTVFSEPPVDFIHEETFEAGGARVFDVEFLPGQFDQRADSAVQCVKLLNDSENPVICTATTYVIEGQITESQFAAIKENCINPVDSRVAASGKPETLAAHFCEPEDVHIFDGFTEMNQEELKDLYESLGLAMTIKDFIHIQNYYKEEEHRDPSMTEIRVLDTYWSDHCRHTTFSTEFTDVSFGEGEDRKSTRLNSSHL